MSIVGWGRAKLHLGCSCNRGGTGRLLQLGRLFWRGSKPSHRAMQLGRLSRSKGEPTGAPGAGMLLKGQAMTGAWLLQGWRRQGAMNWAAVQVKG